MVDEHTLRREITGGGFRRDVSVKVIESNELDCLQIRLLVGVDRDVWV